MKITEKAICVINHNNKFILNKIYTIKKYDEFYYVGVYDKEKYLGIFAYYFFISVKELRNHRLNKIL